MASNQAWRLLVTGNKWHKVGINPCFPVIGKGNTINPEKGLQFDSYELSITTAVQGQGIALAMHPYIAGDIQTGILVDLFPDHHTGANGDGLLACRQEKSHLKRIEIFRQWILEQVRLDQDIPESFK